MTRGQLKKQIDAIEASYEFFLAYAAQGATGEAAERSDGQVRDSLTKMDDALSVVAPGFRELIALEPVSPAEPYHAMIDLLERDSKNAQAAVQFVMAQPSISSQLIDNLNSSTHVRAMLTDMFLVDEVLGVGES